MFSYCTKAITLVMAFFFIYNFTLNYSQDFQIGPETVLVDDKV